MAHDVDYAIVGGGLQAGLVALAVRARRPKARIAIVERGRALGGNHTWCFHAGDLAPGSEWIEPLVVARWDGYDIAFPRRRRTLASPYACVTSARLDACVRPIVDELWLGEPAVAIEPHRVATARRELTAQVVIDARGPDRVDGERCGWQVFVGHELQVRDHGLVRPIVMDATVAQSGRFAFMYVLPLAPDRLLVEDTALTDGAYLDVAAGRAAIARYAEVRGWAIDEVLREETGVLPLPLAFEAPAQAGAQLALGVRAPAGSQLALGARVPAGSQLAHDPPAPAGSPLVAGYAGGWFHPVTGYSFPIAARLAALIASQPPDRLFGPALAAFAAAHRAQLAFALRLNRMLFGWFAPEQRYHVLERFYGLPEDVIRRFYALELTALDRARILVGRPPRGMSWRAALGLARRSA